MGCFMICNVFCCLQYTVYKDHIPQYEIFVIGLRNSVCPYGSIGVTMANNIWVLYLTLSQG